VGATVALSQFGGLGFANQDGVLVLTVPWGRGTWLREKLGGALVRGPEEALSLDGTARVAQAWVRLLPGMRASVPKG